MSYELQAFFHPATSTVTYLVWEPASRQAAVIDPVLDYEPKRARITTDAADALLAAVAEKDLTLAWVLETHADHLSAADYLRRRTGAKIGVGRRITEVQGRFKPLFGADDVVADGSSFDRLLDDGEEVVLGSTPITVLHTPGHTSACVTYLIEDAAFVGDTVFMPDYGTARTDFPGGDAATLYRSIRRILDLPPDTRIFVGHDYLPEGRTQFAWESTVAEQRARNVHVHDGIGEAEFVAMRRSRDATLAAPVLILPSLQVNIRAGALPPAEAGGKVFLRLPVNAL